MAEVYDVDSSTDDEVVELSDSSLSDDESVVEPPLLVPLVMEPLRMDVVPEEAEEYAMTKEELIVLLQKARNEFGNATGKFSIEVLKRIDTVLDDQEKVVAGEDLSKLMVEFAVLRLALTYERAQHKYSSMVTGTLLNYTG